MNGEPIGYTVEPTGTTVVYSVCHNCLRTLSRADQGWLDDDDGGCAIAWLIVAALSVVCLSLATRGGAK